MMRKVWNILMATIWIIVLVWMFYYRADIRAWLDLPVSEIPVRHIIGICFAAAWFGSSLTISRK